MSIDPRVEVVSATARVEAWEGLAAARGVRLASNTAAAIRHSGPLVGLDAVSAPARVFSSFEAFELFRCCGRGDCSGCSSGSAAPSRVSGRSRDGAAGPVLSSHADCTGVWSAQPLLLTGLSEFRAGAREVVANRDTSPRPGGRGLR